MRNDSVKSSLSIIDELPDITGNEEIFFKIIICLSNKISIENSYKISSIIIKETLKDNDFIVSLCNSLKGFHTHNCKIFNPLVKGRAFAELPQKNSSKSPYIYTDTLIDKTYRYFGWAGDAKLINKRFLLCTEFKHKNKHTCLYMEFLKKNSNLVDILIDLGLTKAGKEKIGNACEQHHLLRFPSDVPNQQVQVLMPLEDNNYYALSPVTSSIVQTSIHRFCKSEQVNPIGKSSHLIQRSILCGALSTTTNGDINCLAPQISIEQNEAFIEPQKILQSLKSNQSLLKLTNLEFSFFLSVSKSANFETNSYELMPDSVEKAAIMRRVEKNITQLFKYLDALRSSYQLNDIDIKLLGNILPIEKYYIVTNEFSANGMKSIWNHVNKAIHKFIANTSYSKLAYHPTLTRYINKALKEYLKPCYRGIIESAKPYLPNNEKSPDSIDFKFKKNYLLIPNLSVFFARSNSSNYVIGLPCITSVLGFVENYKLELQDKCSVSLGDYRAAIFISNFQPVAGIKKHEPYRWNDKTNAPLSDIISKRYCHLTFDLVIECSLNESVLNENYQNFIDFIPDAFASGKLILSDEIDTSDKNIEAIEFYCNFYELWQKLVSEKLNRWVLLDHSPNFHRDTKSILIDIADEFQQFNNYGLMRQLSLSSIGYKLLETPRIRKNSRKGYLHAYCEPIIGVQELCNLNIISEAEIINLPAFWHYRRQQQLFISIAESLKASASSETSNATSNVNLI